MAFAVLYGVQFLMRFLWPCMPCIRPFDGPLIIPYSYNSSGFTGAFMRSVWLYFAMVL